MLKALLIDDEASARTDLHARLAVHPEVAIVGEAATIRSARHLLAYADYDLVFLDVQLIGGESFQLLPNVRAGTSIVFTTAHDRYAVHAFECGAVDYLLKPIDPARLAEALRRAAVTRASSVARVGPALPAHLMPRTDNARPVIAASFAEVALTGHERVFLRQCLEAWEDTLPLAHPLRASVSGIARAVHYERGREPTQMFVARAPTSRTRRWWSALRKRLESMRPEF